MQVEVDKSTSKPTTHLAPQLSRLIGVEYHQHIFVIQVTYAKHAVGPVLHAAKNWGEATATWHSCLAFDLGHCDTLQQNPFSSC